ncbi:hypothetical protein [Halalkalibacter krulwichiae]|uniref:Uncharacterized protein n=1 Tax=Halalkalibacter krulwichiae TaxID=199441 RepID=A0A1X9MA74_9BACI|nr:hypothetical protein [Halalkalibacter krulwichiae]ARK30359.1 hypothetical protein BkAM31D_11270 [Halalkalibacter krulwichiae]
MRRLCTLLSAILLAFVIAPGQILAAGGGAEDAAHAEPSGLLLATLTIMSILTLVVMIFFSFRDNG